MFGCIVNFLYLREEIRKGMFVNYEEELNGVQLDAVRYLDGPALVIAGAGSGKTRVLTYKISYLLEQGYEPWSILALTFTNKAAKEMKERIARQVGERTASYLWMGTFHSIFSKILRREAHLLGYDPNFTIYDQADSRSLVKSIIKEMQLDDKTYKPASVAERISAAKSRLITPEDYSRDQGLLMDDQRARIPSTAEIYSRYTARCLQANAMDFDDLLVNTYKLFSHYPAVCEKYAAQFRYVLVDEYQDTNYVQGCIVWLLTQTRRAICVVGDDAQSIYSFRGANIGNILGFTKQYSNAVIFKLEQNYRSTKMIVNAANSLIEKNSEQIHKTVYSERGEGDPVALYQAYSDYEEVEIVANKISELRRKEGYDYSDYAILYRTNAQSRLFEETFRKRSVPYRIFGGLSFYQRKEIKDVIAYFRLTSNSHDEEALKRIINYPARGIGDTTIEKVKRAAIEHNVSMWRVILSPSEYGLEVNKGTLTKLQSFASMIEAFSESAATNDALTTAREIIQSSGIRTEIYHDSSVEGKSRQENLEELINGISEFVQMRNEEGDEHNRLADYISSVQLLTDQDTEGDGNEDYVTLMTIHSAKGLEFKTVFVVGLEEELFPNAMAQNSLRELEEERRLFYVAITRAMDHCILTYAKSRYRYGAFGFSEPSRFLKEIDRKYLSFNGAAPAVSRPQQPQGMRAGLFAATNERRSFGQQPSVQERFQQREPAPVERPVNRTYSTHNLQKVSDAIRHSSPSAPAPMLSVGAIVQHDRFGVGEVLTLEGTGDNAKATIKFRNAGVKTLLLKFAKLTLI